MQDEIDERESQNNVSLHIMVLKTPFQHILTIEKK